MKKTGKRIVSLFLVLCLLAAVMGTTALAAGGAQTTDEVTQLEKDNLDKALALATQGAVLLENKNDVLPLSADEKSIALFGGGAVKTISGGTGSGDVNERETPSLWESFEAADYTITSTNWLEDYQTQYEDAEAKWTGGWFNAFKFDDTAISNAQLDYSKGADAAIYVIRRNSGEGADRTATKGDYYLSDTETANLELLAKTFDKVIVLLNIGGIIDTDFIREIPGIDSVLLISQGGQKTGDAAVQLVSGAATPSGKLTDSWALDYGGPKGYPSSITFGSNDGDVAHEVYDDDIYVGYRYFDTFGIDVAYPFGYGMSYTTFDVKTDSVTVSGSDVTVKATVTNTGDTYSGKEVVEVYFSAPAGDLEKPYQELAAYGKTDELKPGQTQTLTITYDMTDMSSYSEEQAGYIMEPGNYIIRVGNSSRNTHVGAVLKLSDSMITEQLSNLKVADIDIDALSNKDAKPITYATEADEIAAAPVIDITPPGTVDNASPYTDQTVTTYAFDTTGKEDTEHTLTTKKVAGIQTDTQTVSTTYTEKFQQVPALPSTLTASTATLYDVKAGTITMEQFVACLSATEMANICEGASSINAAAPIIGMQSNSVKGAAGETTGLYFDSRKIVNTVLSDGPAGIRITQHYTAPDPKDPLKEQDYYQFCTAMPIGTLYAQSWDVDVCKEVGNVIGSEMEKYGVTVLLAPGMNIHRNPLCGRNFEYYSEDPYLSGMTAAYATEGVQSHDGLGVSIKHYTANNQENNRNAVNNSISERAMREIYLKGFEICVKKAQPMTIMTCYNLNNSWPAADDYELCTDLPRGEWGFKGYIMTDWGGGQSTPINSMHAGNDMITPGGTPNNILRGLMDLEPSFNEMGYVTTTSSWGVTTENWNDFVLDPAGTVKITAPVTETIDAATQTKIDAAVTAGTAKINKNAAGKTESITYTGKYVDNNVLALGDLQKSTMHILNVNLQSSQFMDLYNKDNPSDTIAAGSFSYSKNNDAPVADGYKTTTKGTISETLTFETNDGSEVNTVTGAAGTQVDLSTIAPPTKDGYTFGGWYEDEALTKPISSVTLGSGTTTVYAKWTPDSSTHTAFVTGYTDGTIKPNNSISRAEVAALFYRLMSEEEIAKYASASNSFTDVASGSWYYDAVTTLAAAEYINGYPNGTFRPSAPITRAEFTAIAVRFNNLSLAESGLFGDTTSHWATRYIAAASKAGLVTGYPDGTFHPDSSITRAEAITMLIRSEDRTPDKSYIDAHASELTSFSDLSSSHWAYYNIVEATDSHTVDPEAKEETWVSIVA